MTPAAQLVLASASPRRLQLLQTLGLQVEVRPCDLDESVHPGETPLAYVERLALGKALAGWAAAGERLPSLGADTTVVLDGTILGKPADRDDGVAMLQALSGRIHEVATAVAVASASDVQARVSVSRVTFGKIDAVRAQRYWETGEPRDKAGGYGIQGIGGIFVERLEGSWSGVVGLPLAETEQLLEAAGVDCWRYRCGGNGSAS